jgi:hypothetical protein
MRLKANPRLRGRPVGTLMDSDRDGLFSSKKFTMVPRNNGLVGSMERTPYSRDITAMDSFNALRQKNVLNRKLWVTRKELRPAIIPCIVRTYI